MQILPGEKRTWRSDKPELANSLASWPQTVIRLEKFPSEGLSLEHCGLLFLGTAHSGSEGTLERPLAVARKRGWRERRNLLGPYYDGGAVSLAEGDGRGASATSDYAVGGSGTDGSVRLGVMGRW